MERSPTATVIALAGAKSVYQAAQKRYIALGVEERVKLRIAPGLDHEAMDETEIEALIAWFVKWLR